MLYDESSKIMPESIIENTGRFNTFLCWSFLLFGAKYFIVHLCDMERTMNTSLFYSLYSMGKAISLFIHFKVILMCHIVFFISFSSVFSEALYARNGRSWSWRNKSVEIDREKWCKSFSRREWNVIFSRLVFIFIFQWLTTACCMRIVLNIRNFDGIL